MTKTSTAPRLCSARHPTRDGVRCHRPPGHIGPHHDAVGDAWPRNPRGATPAQRAAGAASAVLTDLAAGFSHSAIAKRHGISRQRVGAIAAAAGQSGPKRSTKGLLSRLLELAAAAGEDPSDWLETAAQVREVYSTGSMGAPNGGYTGVTSIVWPNPVRATVEASDDLVDVTFPVPKR